MATNEMGTYFNFLHNTFSTVTKMLIRMFIGEPEGNYDRVLDFSTAKKTGTLFFCLQWICWMNLQDKLIAFIINSFATSATPALK